jgi:predicted nucleic acid-binding protein
VDEKDSVFIALTLQLKARLWTGDIKLINGLTAKGFIDFYQS